MSTPANIRVNIGAPFPALVKGSSPVTIAKANGIWTVGFQIANLGAMPLGTDPTMVELLLWNTATKSFQQTTLAQASSSPQFQRLFTAAGNIAVLANDRVILVKQAVPAAVNIILPAAASRNGVPLTVKDFAGVAAANPLTFVPNAADIIDGAGAPAAVINDNWEAMTLNPLTAQGGPAGWWIG
jgi:hypothetical protein